MQLKKGRRTVGLVLFLMMLLCSNISCFSAEETETEVSIAADADTLQTGWQTTGKYTYYYNKKGKLITGWKKIDGSVYYFRETAGKKAPVGSMVSGGLTTIKGSLYYFNKQGVLKTGWKKIGQKYYYFITAGSNGVLGKAITGLCRIKGSWYYFGKDGAVMTGWIKIRDNKYYFTSTSGIGSYGKALAGGWNNVGTKTYYFNDNGIMQKNCWINNTYYLKENGRILKSSITPDGWIVDKYGKKQSQAKGWVTIGSKTYYYKNGKLKVGLKKISGKTYYFDEDGVRQTGFVTLGTKTYYFNESGVMQTGWVKIEGKKYYFKKSGVMVTNDTIDGVKIGSDGVAEVDVSILILSGHGQGDIGAYATYKNTYYEYQCTRQFATLIYNNLKGKNSRLSVTLYDQNYDCYQVISGKKSGPDPHFTSYDYVLEIHFNATVASSKDPNGDGKCKGCSFYINANKKNYVLETNILKSLVNTGYTQFGCGVFGSSGLLNAKTCQNLGVSYGLLETAFIDDKDDMLFYLNNKEKMAKAVANTILSYYGMNS